MLSALSIAASGMNAAQTNLAVRGHNLANLSTTPFRRQEVVQSSADGGGVTTSLTRASGDGAALETDTVGLLQAKNDFLASAAVFRASDRMLGTLLDAHS